MNEKWEDIVGPIELTEEEKEINRRTRKRLGLDSRIQNAEKRTFSSYEIKEALDFVREARSMLDEGGNAFVYRAALATIKTMGWELREDYTELQGEELRNYCLSKLDEVDKKLSE